VSKRKIVFATGTRADFGKMKPLIQATQKLGRFHVEVFVTGMHMLSKYGSTYREIEKAGIRNIFKFMNQGMSSRMDSVLATTIVGFSNYASEVQPNLVVVHGDRVETLAVAAVGALNNILVAHIEGGEVSGTVDETIRHAVTKLSHVHFVCNEEARRRVLSMGEREDAVFVIGSPDIDIMKSTDLPSLANAKRRYGIGFDEYAILLYHPVTTELLKLNDNVRTLVSAVENSGRNYVVIYPNNEEGSDVILGEYERFGHNDRIRMFPSIRFEHFLTLLRNARFIIGNSSAGVREAECFGVLAIDVGTRQHGRTTSTNVIHVEHDKDQIMDAIRRAETQGVDAVSHFGDGNSTKRFIEIIEEEAVWSISRQKQFSDTHTYHPLQGGTRLEGSDPDTC
jgi:UDP-N-acetylglucosamine 2-epimerase (hydrolysing)